MIETVKNYHLPKHWAHVSSYDGRYELITVAPSNIEYDEVTELFEGMDITEVKRVQNPYMYGRYKLGKEQLSFTRPNYVERKMYHPITTSDMENVAEFNCDYRRYHNTSTYQHSGKNPVFYSSPQVAKTRFAAASCIVVVNVMTTQSTSTASNDRDGEYYPEYFVLLG